MAYQSRIGRSRSAHRALSPTRATKNLPRRRAACLRPCSALLVMALFAGGLWFAYVEGTRHRAARASGDVPLIRADARPIKVKPDNPGGMQIPDRDMLIYDPHRQVVEHLLAPPEKPMPRRRASAAIAGATEAARPQTARCRSIRLAATVAPAPPALSAAAHQQAATSPSKGGAGTLEPAKPAAGIRLQLGSVRSEEAARQEWDRMKRHESPICSASLSAWRSAPISATRAFISAFRRGRSATRLPPIGSAAS